MPHHLLPVRPARPRPLPILALLLAVLAGVGAFTAAAHPLRRPPERALLSLPAGRFVVSVGPATPEWLPVSGRPEILTLIAGRPRSRAAVAANAYVGVVPAGTRCRATPAASHRPFLTFTAFFSAADSARQVTPFTPDGGGADGTFLASAGGVRLPAGPAARACIWLGPDPGAGVRTRAHHHHPGSFRPGAHLAASELVPLLNDTFAASASNLTGAGAGHSGLTMSAMAGAHRFTYTTTRLACGDTTTEPATAVPAGTPASETISLSPSPCTSDTATFRFSVAGLGARTLTYPVTDALAHPPVSVAIGGCELDPLTGASVSAAVAYLAADGCRLAGLQVSPFERPLGRGTVAWAAVDGGVAELAPAGTAVTLVLNGRP